MRSKSSAASMPRTAGTPPRKATRSTGRFPYGSTAMSSRSALASGAGIMRPIDVRTNPSWDAAWGSTATTAARKRSCASKPFSHTSTSNGRPPRAFAAAASTPPRRSSTPRPTAVDTRSAAAIAAATAATSAPCNARTGDTTIAEAPSLSTSVT